MSLLGRISWPWRSPDDEVALRVVSHASEHEEIGSKAVTGRLQEIVGEVDKLHAATHASVPKARLSPCVGWPTRCRVVDDDSNDRRVHVVRISPQNGPQGRFIHLTVEPPGAGVERHLDKVVVDGRNDSDLSVVGEIAAKVWTNVVDDVPVKDWLDAASFVQGLLDWSQSLAEDRRLSESEFDSIRSSFERAVGTERRNPVVHYNLGALLYERYEEHWMREAIGHFIIAFSSSHRSPDRVTRFVGGLALAGLALSYAQLIHRFGNVSEELVVNSRVSAARAVELLSGVLAEDSNPGARAALLRARHAEAFSYHVTDDPADIRTAAAIYEDTITGWRQFCGEVPPTLLNNLGYQYMALEGKDEPGCDLAAYEPAKRLFLEALETDSDYEMAWANLGNVQRLQKLHHDAEQSYRSAIAAAQTQGRAYPPAHSELARLFLEMGSHAEALSEHQQALALCEEPMEAARFHGEWADALSSVNRDDEACEAARRALAINPHEPRSVAVVERSKSEPT